MKDMSKPEEWERRTSETDRAWNAFTTYRDLGAHRRSLQATHDAVYGEAAGNLRYVEVWSSEHEWVKRVRAWDAHVDERVREKLVAIRLGAVEQRLAATNKILKFALAALSNLDASDTQARDVTALLKLGLEQQRRELEPYDRAERQEAARAAIDDALKELEKLEPDALQQRYREVVARAKG
jgi:hypothetical protein